VSTRSLHILPVLRRALVVLVLTLAAGWALADRAEAAELGLVTDLTWGASSSDQEREYAQLSDLRARWIRVEVNWAEVEPARGSYHQWSLDQIDAAVRRNRAAGRHVVLMIGKAPQWASGASDQGTPPRDPADYGRFVRFLAARYAGDGIAGYEIWNEENIGRFWGGAADAAAYVALLRAGSAAVRAADPDAAVVFGGLSTNDYDFVRAAYAAGAKGLFDVMALHPYSCESDLAAIKRDGSGRIAPGSFLGYRAIHDLMVARGDAKPMWFTELGWATTSRPCGVSEAVQAQRLAASAALVRQDAYVQAVMYYNLRNSYWMHDADDTEAQYGLMTSGFRAKPAYAAFKAAAGQTAPAAAAPPVRRSAPARPVVAPASRGAAPRAPKVRVRIRSVRRVRSHGRVVMRVAGRLLGGPRAARVHVSLAGHGRRVHRTVGASRGRFTVAVRGARAGRWRLTAAFAGRPRTRAAAVLIAR
jgi:polysaccharide biosynthesis protein PslG